MTYYLNLFDQFGNVRVPDDSEILKCTAEQRPVAIQLVGAAGDTLDEDARFLLAEASLRKAQTALDRAQLALEAVQPKWTAHMEWQKTVARLPVPEPDPAATKKVDAATAVVAAAQLYLDESVAAIPAGRQRRDQKRAEFARKLREWAKVNPAPTADDVTRQWIASQQATRAANVAAGLGPAPQNVPVVNASPVDQRALARGKSGTHSPLRSNVSRRIV
jgi:hypothetical protein